MPLRTRLLAVLVLCSWPVVATGQWASVNAGVALPASCRVGDVYITTTTPALNACTTPNTWTELTLLSAGGGAAWGAITGTLSNQADLQSALTAKAPLASPTFTGTVGGITKAMVGLGNVDNTTDAGKPVSSATQTALNLKAPLASPTFTGTVTLPASTALVTPAIGAATGTSVVLTGNLTTTGGVIGYAAGSGGTVTQATSKSTGVTLSKSCGDITMNGAALAAATIVSFTLTNTGIAAPDVLVLNHVTTGTRGAYSVNAQAAAGSAVIYVRNNTAGSLSEAIVVRFCVIKGSVT